MSQLNQLTKKNQEFVNIATKQLLKDGKSDSEIKAILEEALPQILERQAAGETARHFLGAPTAWASSFSQPQVKEVASREKNTDPKLMFLDVTLLLAGLIPLLNVVISLTGKDTPPTRLLSLLVLVLLGGVAMYANYHFIYRHMGKGSQERPTMGKNLLVLVATMGLWVIVSSVSVFLPEGINPVLSNPVLLVVAAIALGARFYLKHQFNIQSAFTPSR